MLYDDSLAVDADASFSVPAARRAPAPAPMPDRPTLPLRRIPVPWEARQEQAPVEESWLFRALDVGVVLAAILFFAPLMLLIAAAVRLEGPGSVVFAHNRIGRGGKQFRCLKFRSMVADAEDRLQALLRSDPESAAEWESAHKLRRDPRVTRVGRFLRRTSLDELPQLFNVLRGEMSIVGPRPIVRDEVARFGRYFEDYCRVQPGITGLWQINGRSDLTYRKRVALDVLYARRRSVKLNLKIVLLTIPCVLGAKGSC